MNKISNVLKIGRILSIYFLFIVFTLVIGSLKAFAQQTTFDSAVVIVEKDFLKTQPSHLSSNVAVVVKGAKLKVTPSTITKGWYIAILEESPSIAGYIHGNFIRITKIKKKAVIKKNVPKIGSTVIPKGIYLDVGLPEIKPIPQKAKNVPVGKNYCQPPFFCPDINDVQTALINNKDKFQKGKFEKTLDWENRKPTILRDIKLHEGRTAADNLYFLYDSGKNSFTYDNVEYDADKELWTFELNFSENSYTTNIPIYSQSTGQILYLIVSKKLGSKVKALVSMSPSIARANDKKLQIALVGKIIEPFLWSNDYSSVRNVISGIYFNLEEIICLNPDTGQKWKTDIPLKQTEIISSLPENSVDIDYDEELTKYRRALLSEPMSGKTYLEIGKIYRLRREYDAAISNLTTAIYWDSNLVDAHLELARIYFIKHDCAKARRYFQSASDLDSKNQDLRVLKTLIEKCNDKPIEGILQNS